MKAKTLIAELRKEFFTLINESYLEVRRRRHWTHHDAAWCFDEAVRNLVARIKRGEFRESRSFEERALESFKALVNSEESERFMRDYYGYDK